MNNTVIYSKDTKNLSLLLSKDFEFAIKNFLHK